MVTMRQRTLAKELPNSLGQRVFIRGWLNNVRAFGKLTFLILRDRTGLIQIVVENKDEVKKLEGLQPGSILRIEGTASVSGEAHLGAEVTHPTITVEEAIRDVPPIEYYKPEMHN